MKADDKVYPDNISLTKGLVVRDHIAIEAMNGLCIDMGEDCEYTPQDLAQQAYEIADAMIEQSNRSN